MKIAPSCARLISALRSRAPCSAATSSRPLFNTAPRTQRAATVAMAHTYPYPRPSLTVDTIIVARQPSPQLLLIQRKHPPCQGAYALPGGFVDENEPLQASKGSDLTLFPG